MRQLLRELGNGRGLSLLWGRLAQSLPVLLFATFVAFGLLKLVPGDIAVTLAGDNASDARIAEIRQLYGLDRSFFVQYFSWLTDAVQGNLSRSLLSGEEVATSIARSLPHTLLIVVMALVLAFAVGAPLGILAAAHQGRGLDRVLMALSSLGVAVPNFWLAMVMIAFFALQLGWFPVTGAVAWQDDWVSALHHAALPAMALAAGGIAEVARQIRSSLAELAQSQQVRTLHAKGLSSAAILWKHGLKNVGINLLTVLTLLANRMLAATVVIEAVFAIPGVGSLIVGAALQRDFPVVQGVILVLVVIVLLLNLLADLLYRVIDPRLH
ncbi:MULTISPECIES: ABC transporter permease [unclassified Simplicispira]|jgi:peptide/nickel transport system permease protein|uniref:ABC transporter permease n=1 Tax=unclassified Simplicispira TaxID=2630407 RepID=UPI000D5D2836|nr:MULTISPECIES: ABC transporter permease [unclassified Simplicispira]PVY55833.1 peptide/nickel transport system permease protein [Simplicispira sp. 125]REG16776.1 peptide/nickel transport system permease protein [Simplicispira sp. 110]